MKFCELENYEGLLKLKPEKINRLIEDWIMELKETNSPNSIPTMYYGIELFFSMNDVTLNMKKLRRMFPAKVKRSGDKPYTTDNIQKILSVTRYKRDRAFILFLVSTGARVGVMDDLKLKHIEEIGNGCKSVLMYANYEEEYYGFLTPEASAAMDEYFAERQEDGEKLTPESPVFRTTWSKGVITQKPLTVTGAKNIIYRALKHARIKRNKIGNNYDVQLDMGFRKRFNTILKLNNDVNFNIAEKLMAHKRGLDGAYLKPTRDQCFYEFSKAISELTVSSEERQKLKIEQQEKQISDFEKQQNEIDDLKGEITKIKLRNEIVEAMKQGMVEWSEKNPDKVHPLQVAKADFRTASGIDEFVEHLLTEHDGSMDGIREMYAKAKYSLKD